MACGGTGSSGAVVYLRGWFVHPPGAGHLAALLCVAWKLTGDERYRGLAEDHFHYLCGRNVYRLCDISNVAEETYSWPLHVLEWTPDRDVWMPGCVMHMSISQCGNLSRFLARRLRVSRHSYYFGDICVGFNFGATAAAMMLMEGGRYNDLIEEGAFPGLKPFRPGLPFAPTPPVPYGAEPVTPHGENQPETPSRSLGGNR